MNVLKQLDIAYGMIISFMLKPLYNRGVTTLKATTWMLNYVPNALKSFQSLTG